MSDRNLRLPEVLEVTGLSKTEVYRRIKEKRFPAGVRISHRVAVWPEADVQTWVTVSRLPRHVREMLS